MANTKEEILITALTLFAKDGYEAVSVSQIAGALNMTKGALYRHYENKRDIFESIVKRMEEKDMEQANKCQVPETTMEENKNQYENTTLEHFLDYCRSMFLYWTEDEFASLFRRMLTIEQFRNDEMQALFQQYLVDGPLGYVKDLFVSMGIKEAEQNAIRLYSAMVLFYSLYDGAKDKNDIKMQFGTAMDNMMSILEKER